MTETTKPSDIKFSELSIENEALKARNAELKTSLDETSQALKLANDMIEADIKGRVSQKILANSKYTIEDLSKMSVDEMKGIERVLDMSHLNFKGIRPGIGQQTDETNLTVPNKFAFGKKGA